MAEKFWDYKFLCIGENTKQCIFFIKKITTWKRKQEKCIQSIPYDLLIVLHLWKLTWFISQQPLRQNI